jgi:predicted nucleotidyltransferase
MARVPDTLQNDIDRAVDILKAAGCRECYIFGSIAAGSADENSDIDIAICGLPPERFFYVYGQMPAKIDLIDLDDGSRFSRRLRRRGAMVRVF